MVINDGNLILIENSDIINGHIYIPDDVLFITCNNELKDKVTSVSFLNGFNRGELVNFPNLKKLLIRRSNFTRINSFIDPFFAQIEEIILPDNLDNISYGCFRNMTNLKIITIPDSVTTIASEAFYNCTSLKSIILPPSLKSIDARAFSHSGLTNITFNEGLKRIASYAFLDTKLTSLSIPNSVTYIGDGCFEKCEQLHLVNLPDKLTTISNRLFCNCSSLIKVTLPKSVELIDSNAFYGCSKLAYMEFPDSLNTIGIEAFAKCTLLNDVVLKETVETLKRSAFMGCCNLSNIYLPSSLKKIEESCFEGCNNLKEITIPDNVKVIDNKTFAYCQKLKKVNFGKCVQIINYSAFIFCENLQSLDLPDSLYSIGKEAFSNCYKLQNIKFPLKLHSIDDRAFQFCESISQIKMNNNLELLGSEVFKSCKNLKTVELSKKIKHLNTTFSNCHNLETISLKNIIYISNYTFYCCNKLSNIELSNKLEYIGNGAFYHCSSLVNITLPDTVNHIGEEAFAKCEKLSKINIPEGIENILVETFFDCRNLTQVTLPSSLKKIHNAAFLSCHSLSNIDFPNGLETIQEDAFSQTGLEIIKLPDSLLNLGTKAFYDTRLIELELPRNIEILPPKCFAKGNNDIRLTKLIIPDNIKIIGEYCFSKCNIKELVLSNNLEYINTRAFEKNLITHLRLPSSLKRVSSFAFSSCNKLTTIEVEKGVEIIENSVFDGCKRTIKDLKIYDSTICLAFSYPLEKATITLINSKTNQQIFTDVSYGGFSNTRGDNAYIYKGDIKTKADKLYFFDFDNKIIEIAAKDLFYRAPKNLELSMYKILYEWLKRKKFIPSCSVIETLPTSQIDNFYINNNCKRWGNLVSVANINSNEEKSALFKLCYVLGMFNVSSKDSQKAYDFIKNNIIDDVNEGKYHVKYGGINLHNGYNKIFADLVFKYYNDYKETFLIDTDKSIDYFCAVFNNFDKILTFYPHKEVNTNTRNELLTPEMCLNSILFTTYDNVKQGNEEFASNMAIYGYTQEEFNRGQHFFEKGKAIPKDELTLFIKNDISTNDISYELLEKDNPLGIVLGDITNCCQKLIGLAHECVEHGLSERNSKFMIFKKDEVIIGQSWVWYDEKTKVICLDNIEIPDNVMKKFINDSVFEKQFLSCINRIVNGFIEEMKNKNLEVERITIGAGFNDINHILTKKFTMLRGQSSLSNYYGYTDAGNQYLIYQKERK